MIYLVALLAKAGHGKTTIANHLRDAYGAKIVSLAGPLKRAAKKVMNFSDEQIYGTQAQKEAIDPRYGFSARTFLQKLGTEGLREEFGWNVHVNALLHEITTHDAQNEGTTVYVIDDARFPNEVEAVVNSEDHHGACVKIICTDAPPTPGGNHASETGIDLIPEEQIAFTVTSSRAKGVQDLIAVFEAGLRSSVKLAPIYRALTARSATS